MRIIKILSMISDTLENLPVNDAIRVELNQIVDALDSVIVNLDDSKEME